MKYRELSEEEIKLRFGQSCPEEHEKKDINFMRHRKLTQKEKKQLETYIDYSKKYMKNLESGKEHNYEFLGEYGGYFPEPGFLPTRVLPLDNPQGLFEYYKNSIKVFREILKRGTISEEQEQSLELRLNESFDEELLQSLV